MKNLTRYACFALLVTGLLFLSSARAQDQDKRPPGPGKSVEPGSQAATINAELSELKKTQDAILKMLQDAAQVRQDFENKILLQTQKALSDVAALKERVERLEERANRAAAELDAQVRRMRGGVVGPSATTPATGTIQLTNLYWIPITVVVDGFAYVLQPNETRYLNRQPGTFTYEVVGVQASVARALAAGETFAIRINR